MEAAGRSSGVWAIVGLGGGYSKPRALKLFNLSFQRQNYPCSFKTKSKAEEGRKEKKRKKIRKKPRVKVGGEKHLKTAKSSPVFFLKRFIMKYFIPRNVCSLY